MQSAPLPEDEEQRLLRLQAYRILDTPPEEGFDRITRLAARLFEVPIVLVSLIDRDRQWFKSRVGLDACETSRDIAFCAHAILRPEVMEVPDATADLRFSTNPLVTGAPGIRFYAGAPLAAHDGRNLGTLCLIDTRPRRLSETDREMLRDLAAMVVDALDLRRAAQAALDRSAEAVRLQELKDEFLSMASHELRTPLTAIRGALGLVDGGIAGPLPDKAAECVAIAHRNAVQLGNLVDDLLDIQKLEAGRMSFDFTTVDLRRLVDDTLADLAPVATGRRVTLTAAMEDDPTALADPGRLKQVLTNLLSNAIKFSPEDATVTVRVDPGPQGVQLSVADQGPGVPAGFLPHMFERFSQAPGNDRPKGTGLGLAISKAIVDAHGGRISVDTAPGRGTTMHVDLPATGGLAAAG